MLVILPDLIRKRGSTARGRLEVSMAGRRAASGLTLAFSVTF
ncbi:Hypothetical protein A7982_06444 [Minicystis rosea]|nr:Hypothetical protein A7982_06444 [Minicystis rosea]